MKIGKLYRLKSPIDGNWSLYSNPDDAVLAFTNTWARVAPIYFVDPNDVIMPVEKLETGYFRLDADGENYYRVIVAGLGITGWLFVLDTDINDYWEEPNENTY